MTYLNTWKKTMLSLAYEVVYTIHTMADWQVSEWGTHWQDDQ